MKPRALLVVLVLIASCETGPLAAAAPQEPPSLGKLRPVDEFTRDPSLRKLRDEILALARRRDLPGLAALSADRLSIEGEAMTRQEFMAWFRRMPQPEQTLFWQHLRDGMV